MKRPGPEGGGARLRVGASLVALSLLSLPVAGDAQESPAAAATATADAECLTCHGPQGSATVLDVALHRQTVHGALSCLVCHEKRHKGVPDNPLTEATIRSEACLQCHAGVDASHLGDALGSPACTACHSPHTDPQIARAGASISERCGSCHAQPMRDFAAGGHAPALTESGVDDLPTCVTCHPSHREAETWRRDPRIQATALCIDCHSRDLLIAEYGLPEEVGASYTNDFHGATLQFLWRHPGDAAQPKVLVCSDCHGAHDVGWVASDQVADVCLGCHENADESFAGAWLGHEPVGPRNAVLVWAARAFYYVLIPLVVGGLVFNIVLQLRNQRRAGVRVLSTHRGRARRAGAAGGKAVKPETVTRFSRVERLEHLVAMVTFTLLVATGIPQTVPTSTVGNWLVDLFGGIGWTRLIHRGVGLVFVATLVLHVGRGVVGAIRRRRLPEVTIGRRDFADVVQTLRHYIRRDPKPKAGKFDFREKFEYWGLLLGGTLMTVTGFVLLFPEVVSIVLPGSVIAAAKVVHGLEATFAVLVIVVWHSYAVILRPEIFPLDTTMFTGEITVERLREEHELEYERRFPDRLESLGQPTVAGPHASRTPSERVAPDSARGRDRQQVRAAG